MTDTYIYDCGHTAFGRYCGCLSGVRPDDLLAHVIRELVRTRQNIQSACRARFIVLGVLRLTRRVLIAQTLITTEMSTYFPIFEGSGG